jgi:hypothetical protein
MHRVVSIGKVVGAIGAVVGFFLVKLVGAAMGLVRQVGAVVLVVIVVRAVSIGTMVGRMVGAVGLKSSRSRSVGTKGEGSVPYLDK